ncbi:unnamed protein product [Rhizoctonia solani]|nr:unnamed protein product [Rhizoctonia solani]
MPSYPDGHILLPPTLPPYLKSVYELKPLVGNPRDDEVIGLHAVIRMAQKAVDIPGTGDPKLLARLYEHLFDVQMGKYSIIPHRANELMTTVHTPPTLPVHVTIDLEPITGAPSEEEIIKVQSAIRAYQHFASVPSIFDSRVDMELSQHLFDIQMANYTQRVRQSPTRVIPQETLGSNSSIERTTDVAEEPSNATINAATGAAAIEFNLLNQSADVSGFGDAIEHSNRPNERANQLVERSSQSMEQSTKLAEKFNELFEKFNDNSEKSSLLAEASTKQTERLGDILENVNKVLVTIQHAIVRNHKGNTRHALDCLANEKGETPGISETTTRVSLLLDAGYNFDVTYLYDSIV